MTTPGLMRAYKTEMEQGYARLASLDLDAAFQHFERAHILGQRRTWLHVRAHAAMLKVGWLRSDVREIAAQLSRVVAASVGSRLTRDDSSESGFRRSVRIASRRDSTRWP
jgi:hypothetical protein